MFSGPLFAVLPRCCRHFEIYQEKVCNSRKGERQGFQGSPFSVIRILCGNRVNFPSTLTRERSWFECLSNSEPSPSSKKTCRKEPLTSSRILSTLSAFPFHNVVRDSDCVSVSPSSFSLNGPYGTFASPDFTHGSPYSPLFEIIGAYR